MHHALVGHRLTESESSDEMDDEDHSPFLFTALPASSSTSTVLTKNKVFLKVFDMEDENKHSAIYSEWMHYKQAWEAGVPVAAPALADVAISTSSCGKKYLIMAVEYIPPKWIETIEDLVQFSHSLMDTVDQLHQKAKLLHCDLKPDNMRWSRVDRVVRLIDFGRAQPIESAKCIRRTKGYEAPEISSGKPCSIKTDAFAIGRTIVAYLQTFQTSASSFETDDRMRKVARCLTTFDSQSRWSLKRALDEIQKIMQRKRK